MQVLSASAIACILLSALMWEPFAVYHPLPVSLAMLALLVVSASWLVVQSVLGRARAIDLVPLVLAVPLVNLVLVLAPTVGSPPAEQPWTEGWSILAVCGAVLAFSRRPAILSVVATSLSYAALRAPLGGWPIAVVETLIPVWGAFVAVWGVQFAARAQQAADAAATAAETAMAEADRQDSREAARRWWDRLLHDKVIGALMLGSRATSPAQLKRARLMAREALQILEADASGEATRPDRESVLDGLTLLSRGIRRIGREHGLTVTLEARSHGEPPIEVIESLLDAVDQALANVERHAGVRAATVRVDQNADRVTVRVIDAGRGFDPLSVDPRRVGLRIALPGHMEAIGGTARVHSRPGHGTEVTLEWRPMVPSSSHEVISAGQWSRWWWFSAGWVLLQAIGALVTEHRLAWGLGDSVAVVCLFAGMVICHVRDRALSLGVGPLVVVASVAALALLTPPADGLSWRLWFVGAVVPLVTFPSVRGRPRTGAAFGIAAALVVLLGYGTHSWAHLRYSAQAAGQLVLFPGLAWRYAVAMARASERLADSLRRSRDARRRVHASRERQRVLHDRARQLDPRTMTLLRKLAHEELFLAEDRLRARVAEAANRDLLVARSLLDEEIVRSAQAARRRGVTVHLTAADRSSGDPEPSSEVTLRAVRASLVDVLAAARPGDRVTARWQPDSGSASATITIARADPPSHGAGADGIPVADVAPDDLFLEFPPTRRGSLPLTP